MNVEDIIARPSRTAPPFWDSERDDVLLCRQVRRETHDVVTFALGAPEPRLFHFRPGQFVTLELEIGGAPVSRCYTASSAPTRPHLLSITVKRVPGGPVSNWLHDRVRPGTALRVSGPLGAFTCAGRPAARSLYLSAGSGITPLMSMARSHDDLASDEDIAFVHSARSPDDIIFRAELGMLARRPGFRFAAICESDAPGESWNGYAGRLSLPMLRLIAPDFAEREIYTCGPAPYMRAVRSMLAEAGFDFARYHEESFDFATLAAEAPDVPAAIEHLDAVRHAVTFSRTRRTISCGPGSTILEAARAAGLRLPSSCAKGLCGTCKSRLVSGRVDMHHAGGIRQREIDAGQILICCSKPLGDLVIER